MLWHGGLDYAAPMPDECETFDSIRDAIDDFEWRASTLATYYPMVKRTPSDNGGPRATLFMGDHSDEVPDPGAPDYVIEFGPRGGVHVKRV